MKRAFVYSGRDNSADVPDWVVVIQAVDEQEANELFHAHCFVRGKNYKEFHRAEWTDSPIIFSSVEHA